jgi:hypothetical protein
MTTDQLSIIVLGVTTIAGTAIGAAVTYLVGRQQFRAAVLSANRQAWINNLRDCIAEYQSLVDGILLHEQREKMSAETRAEKLARLDFVWAKIQLLINPTEQDHQKLAENIRKLSVIVIGGVSVDHIELPSLQKNLTTVAQQVLKREWERVKKGR